MAEKVSPEEAAKLGLKPSAKVSPEEAAKLGLAPKKTAAAEPQAQDSWLSQAIDFLEEAGDYATLDAITPFKAQASNKPLPTAADKIRSAASGITFGGADEAAAVVEAPFRAIGDGVSPAKAYERTHAELQPLYDRAVENDPTVAIGAGFLTGGGEKEVAKQGLNAVRRIGPNIARGVGLGALSGGLFAHEGERTGGALQGGVVGGLLSGAVHKLGDTFSPRGMVYEWLLRKQNQNAAHAIGAKGGISNALRKKGYVEAAEIEDLGKQALDYDMIPFAGTKDAVKRRAEEQLSMRGAVIGDIVRRADDNTAQTVEMAGLGGQGAPLYQNAAGSAQVKVPYNFDQSRMAAKDAIKGGSAVSDDASTEARAFVGQIDRQGKKTPGSFADARKIKSDAQDAVDWSDKAKLNKENYRKSVAAFTEDFQNQIGDVLGSDELEQLRHANKVYGVAADVKDLATEAATSEAANRSIGLIGALSGVGAASTVGATTGSSLYAGAAGIAAPVLENLLRKRGPAAAAVTMRGITNASQKYAPLLKDAQARGPMALAVTNYLLHQKDPEYRAQQAASKEEDD